MEMTIYQKVTLYLTKMTLCQDYDTPSGHKQNLIEVVDFNDSQ